MPLHNVCVELSTASESFHFMSDVRQILFVIFMVIVLLNILESAGPGGQLFIHSRATDLRLRSVFQLPPIGCLPLDAMGLASECLCSSRFCAAVPTAAKILYWPKYY